LLLLVTHTGTVFQAVCNILHIAAADVVDVFQRDTFSCCNRKSVLLSTAQCRLVQVFPVCFN